MKNEFQIIADLIEKDKKVLDVGCADGTLMKFLKDNKNINIRGLEISKEKVQECIAKGLTVIEGNAEKDLKQFPDKSFDYVVLSQTLQAFLNPELVLDELLRVGKKAIVTIPNFGYWKVRFHLLLKGTMPVTKTLPDEWYNTPNLHMCTIKDFFHFVKSKDIKIFKSLALNNLNSSIINESNLGVKNLFADLGIFLIENKMRIEIIPCLQDNYSYLIIDESNNFACVVDPSESEPIINFLKNKNIKLKYILNTHHHYDHIGGNQELKKKYRSVVVGFKGDSKRIPEIDILLEDNQIWKAENFEAKIMHIPGHTSGHICFNFFKEKLVFTGDTLFSLGCGRIFEGSYEEMFESLNKIKLLPKETKIYCGHEYTLNNSKFCKKYDSENKDLQKKIEKIEKLRENGIPTIPSTLKEELDCNIFLRAKDVKTFSKLRDFKDNF